MSSTPPPPGPPQKPAAKALNCPQCGAAITLRALGQAASVVCESCHCILDAKTPQLEILQTFSKAIAADRPLIPLGTRGKLRGADYEVIGFQRRGTVIDGIRYFWHEYVLFNPYKGFRYLTEYQGHWNDVTVCKEQPIVETRVSIPLVANYLGEVYRHFQTSDATTDFVLGEFPWQVAVGEQARANDYVHPPRLLSMERTAGETTWSLGEYTSGRDIWSAFRLPGSPPAPQGVFANQPSPSGGGARQLWAFFALLALLLLGVIIVTDFSESKTPVFSASYHLNAGEPKGEASFVTEPFELTGRTSSVEVSTNANVSNSWIYLNYALINTDTEQAWDFGREVSYYYGYDSDGSWHEGSQSDSVVVPSVPAGHYYLRIEPEVAPNHGFLAYTVDVRRDVPVPVFYGIGFVALLLPPLLYGWRSWTFERARWSESDHPPMQLQKSEEDD